MNIAFENRFSIRLFGPNRIEVTREWKRLHDKKLNDLYYSLNIVRVIKSRRMSWVGHEGCRGEGGEGRDVYKVLLGKPEENLPTGKPRRGRNCSI